MSEPERRAFYEGKAAQHGGGLFVANPYPLGTSLSRAWSRGWNIANSEIAELAVKEGR